MFLFVIFYPFLRGNDPVSRTSVRDGLGKNYHLLEKERL